MKRLLSSLLGTVVLTALMVVNALAAPIPAWDYTVDGIFVSWKTTVGTSGTFDTPAQGITGFEPEELFYNLDGGVPVPPGTSAKGYRHIAWGDYVWSGPGPVYSQIPGANLSSIGINARSGTMITDGPTSLGMELYHYNQPILSGSIQLKSGVVRSVLALTPSGNPPLPVFSTKLDFLFFETPNGNVNTESDVFVLLNPEVTEETFHYYGVDYVFSFGGSFGLIPETYRALLNLPVGSVGWITSENAYNAFDTLISIRALPTPEPTSIILMGLGLLGLFGLRRRSQA